MLCKTMTVTDKVGFHTRTAAAFAKLAAQFLSEIVVFRDSSKKANGKSMLSLMSLGVKRGHVITVEAEGCDAAEALETLAQFVAEGFVETDD